MARGGALTGTARLSLSARRRRAGQRPFHPAAPVRGGRRVWPASGFVAGRRRAARLAVVLVLAAPAPALADTAAEQRWGVAVGLRYADIPYEAADEDRADLVPLLYYRGERVFLDGLEGGVTLLRGGAWRLNAYARYRFLDFPRRAQAEARSDSWDIGLQLRHRLWRGWEGRWELLTDGDGRSYIDAGVEGLIGDDYASLRPYAGVRLKSGAFNDRYYGLGQADLDAGADLHARIEGRAHLYRNLYLIGRLSGYYLGAEARRSPAVRDTNGWEALIALGMFEEPRRDARARLRARPYWRAAHGWGTGSSLGDIVLRGDIERDIHGSRLTSLFYGHPLADTIFGWPLALYLSPGLVYHHPSEVQGRAFEYVVALKAYYTTSWPVRVRFGVAEGLSYVTQVPHLERSELAEQGDQPSKFLNYLDVSVDVNAGDLFGLPGARALWIGFGVHHRSGIFETGSQFGHISGGSNYSTLYLQWHY